MLDFAFARLAMTFELREAMSPSANWQAVTVRHTETVRQRDDCPLGQVSPRLGRLAIPALMRSLVFCASTFAEERAEALALYIFP